MPDNKEVIKNEEFAEKPAELSGRQTEIVDLKKEAPIPREVKTWMQKLEEDPSLNQSNNGNQGDDDTVLKSVAPAVTKITLPTNRTTFSGGFAKPVDQAWRWLSEFVLRIIKKNQGRVKFKEE
jgi:hypothetical protein